VRRYILSLSLVSFTAPQEMFLREGCQLVPDLDREAEWNIVEHSGIRKPLRLSHTDVLNYAQEAARSFVVGSAQEGTFDSKRAGEALGQSKEERKKARRGKGRGPENPEEK
jgi:CRISPR-associated protein Csb1